MSDVNYPPLDFANFHGTPENPIQVTVNMTEPGFVSIIGHPIPDSNGRWPAPNGEHSDTIKFSNCSWIAVSVIGRLKGGREDCVDINNKSHHIAVVADEWESGGKYVATIKGESNDVHLEGRIVKHGSEMDIDLGNWSDQSNERTINVFLGFVCDDTIHVRVLNAWAPIITVVGQSFQVHDTWKGIFIWVYRVLKKLHIV